MTEPKTVAQYLEERRKEREAEARKAAALSGLHAAEIRKLEQVALENRVIMRSIMQPAIAEGRTLSETEGEQYDAARDALDDAERKIRRLENAR